VTPIEAFVKGTEILSPVIAPHGFKPRGLVHGHEEWGNWASGNFTRSRLFSAHRELVVHIKQTRIIRVDYKISGIRLDHLAFARAIGVLRHDYPRDTADAALDFQDLANDLRSFGAVFLHRPAREFKALAAAPSQ
jgi:hypothetical protein